MHTEVGQARQPGAKLLDDRYVLLVGGDRWYWSVPFNGGCPVRGKSNYGSVFWRLTDLTSSRMMWCTTRTMWWSCKPNNLDVSRPWRRMSLLWLFGNVSRNGLIFFKLFISNFFGIDHDPPCSHDLCLFPFFMFLSSHDHMAKRSHYRIMIFSTSEFYSITGGEGAWKPMKTSWVHCRLWLKVPATYPPITDWIHSKCSQIMCLTWNLWEHLFNIWNVTSTCTPHLIPHNS